jgi:DNA-binding NarL/FixJ family response regulator
MDHQIRSPRLLIVDDDLFMRTGLRLVLEAKTDFELVGEAADGEEALALCRSLRPALVLMDITMPKIDGIEATRLIKAQFPEISVLVLTSHVDQDVLMDAIKAGAAGYLTKGGGHNKLVEAIEAVLAGETPLEQGLAMQLLRRLTKEADLGERTPEGPSPDSPAASLPNPLTPRETEVLRLLATGKTNGQLAAELHLSLSTVKRHVEHIISKLRVSDRTQAAVMAIEIGLLHRRT